MCRTCIGRSSITYQPSMYVELELRFVFQVSRSHLIILNYGLYYNYSYLFSSVQNTHPYDNIQQPVHLLYSLHHSHYSHISAHYIQFTSTVYNTSYNIIQHYCSSSGGRLHTCTYCSSLWACTSTTTFYTLTLTGYGYIQNTVFMRQLYFYDLCHSFCHR